MKKIVFLTLTLLFAASIVAQTSKTTFLNKTNQHSLSAEYAAVSYSYAHRFKPDVTFGARVQAGAGFQFILLSSPVIYDYGYGNGPEKFKPTGHILELVKLQLFYRYAFSNSFYIDAGPVFSLVTSEADWENPFNAGIEASMYYTVKFFHIGVRLKGAMSFDPHNTGGINSDRTYFGLYATPLFVGINF